MQPSGGTHKDITRDTHHVCICRPLILALPPVHLLVPLLVPALGSHTALPRHLLAALQSQLTSCVARGGGQLMSTLPQVIRVRMHHHGTAHHRELAIQSSEGGGHRMQLVAL